MRTNPYFTIARFTILPILILFSWIFVCISIFSFMILMVSSGIILWITMPIFVYFDSNKAVNIFDFIMDTSSNILVDPVLRISDWLFRITFYRKNRLYKSGDVVVDVHGNFYRVADWDEKIRWLKGDDNSYHLILLNNPKSDHAFTKITSIYIVHSGYRLATPTEILLYCNE